ncbi:hypothetical protein ACFQ0T_40545 [Kitasatospora gansuensis]
MLLYAADADGLAEAAEAVVGMPDSGARAPAVAVLAREAAPLVPGALPVPHYRDAAGEFARLYRPDGPTGLVIRPDGQLGARFPLAGTATALADYLAALAAAPQ